MKIHFKMRISPLFHHPLGVVLFLLFPAMMHAQEFKIDSKNTGDQYIINIKNHRPATKQHLVFVADGSLKLGQYILGSNESWKLDLPANCVVVADCLVCMHRCKRLNCSTGILRSVLLSGQIIMSSVK